MKWHLLAAFWAAFAWSLQAQDTLEVVKTNGPSERFAVDNITRITFTSTDMVVGGPGTSIPINTIAVILFRAGPIAVEKAGSPLPFTLGALAPNPLNSATSLRFRLVRPGSVSVRVYDAGGKMVRQLFSGGKEAGEYSYGWDGRDASGRPLGSGVYQFVLSVNNKTAVKRAVMVR